MRPKDKWRFAIGTTSRVPDSGGLHYLIVDFDCPRNETLILKTIHYLCIKHLARRPLTMYHIQPTPHGWHLYTNIKMNFKTLIYFLEYIGADPSWIKIGRERGYFFLADKKKIKFEWPVEHMVIHHGKEKTLNS